MNWIIGSVLLIFFIYELLKGDIWAIFLLIIAVIIITIGIMYSRNKKIDNDQRKQNIIDQINDIIERHISILSDKKDKLVDDYGHVNEIKWKKEVVYFSKNVIEKELVLSPGQLEFDLDIGTIIDSKIHTYKKRQITEEMAFFEKKETL